MSPELKLASLAGPALRVQPDRRLARLAGEGSEPAFEEIVRRYRPRLIAFAAGIVPAHRAEDIVQESLLRVFSALQESNGDVHLKPWLYTIVRNRALNAVRDERVHVEIDEQYDGVTPPPDIVARREEVSALVAGIQALPEAQRQALVGRELEGLSHDEIAAELGTSPASVRGLIFRARTSLRHAAGALLPLPLLRWITSEADAHSAAAAAVAGGGAIAAGAAAGGAGAGGLALKAGAVVAAAALAAGAGVTLRDPSDGGGRAEAQSSHASDGAQDGGQSGSPNSGPGSGSDDSSGPGSGDDEGPDDSSGPGSGGDGGGEDNSGPGGGDSGGTDSSGPGGGGDSSGSGSGGSSGSGSGTSGSGSSGSGSSGSGSDSSGSGSSGSGGDDGD